MQQILPFTINDDIGVLLRCVCPLQCVNYLRLSVNATPQPACVPNVPFCQCGNNTAVGVGSCSMHAPVVALMDRRCGGRHSSSLHRPIVGHCRWWDGSTDANQVVKNSCGVRHPDAPVPDDFEHRRAATSSAERQPMDESDTICCFRHVWNADGSTAVDWTADLQRAASATERHLTPAGAGAVARSLITSRVMAFDGERTTERTFEKPREQVHARAMRFRRVHSIAPRGDRNMKQYSKSFAFHYRSAPEVSFNRKHRNSVIRILTRLCRLSTVAVGLDRARCNAGGVQSGPYLYIKS